LLTISWPSESFPFPPPVDGNFAHVALANKLFIKELLPKVLSIPTKEFVTRCVVEELRSLGEDFMGAVLLSKNFEHRRCSHKTPVAAADCIKDLIGQPSFFSLSSPRSSSCQPIFRVCFFQGPQIPTSLLWRRRMWPFGSTSGRFRAFPFSMSSSIRSFWSLCQRPPGTKSPRFLILLCPHVFRRSLSPVEFKGG